MRDEMRRFASVFLCTVNILTTPVKTFYGVTTVFYYIVFHQFMHQLPFVEVKLLTDK